MEQYKVTFSDTYMVLNDEELKNFINVAVINNKDIHKFSVERIKQ
jgi:hypothetical protein